MTIRIPAFAVLAFLLVHASLSGQGKAGREALGKLGELVGTWNGTGVPSGSKEEQQKGFWTETISCEWKFKGDAAWLKLDFAKGKFLSSGEVRFVPDKEEYRLTVKTADKTEQVFTGKIKDKVLTVDRFDPESKEHQRIVITLLHENRILYRYDVKAEGKGLYYRKYQVGATRDGVAFAAGDGRPECIVSGGLGTMAVSYMGKTYHVCCSGCRDEFFESPKKYIEEFEQKSKKKTK